MEDARWTEAHMLAALHNGPATRKDRKAWTAEMFMPGYEEPVKKSAFDWQRDLAMLNKVYKPKPEDPKRAEINRMLGERMARASAAQRAGESRERVESIMKGLL